MKAGKLPVVLFMAAVLGMTTGCGTAKTDTSSDSVISNVSDVSAADSSAASKASSKSQETSKADSKASSASEGTLSAADSVATVSYTLKMDSTDGTMEVTLPDNWEDMTGKMDTTGDAQQNWVIEAGCLEEESFLTAVGESKTNTALASLAEYSDTIVQAVSTNTLFTDAQASSTEDLTLTSGGFAAKKTKISATYSGQKIAYWIYAVEGSKRYDQFICWTTEDNASSAEEKFDTIVNSFTEIG